jgi:hypothetical protein
MDYFLIFSYKILKYQIFFKFFWVIRGLGQVCFIPGLQLARSKLVDPPGQLETQVT